MSIFSMMNSESYFLQFPLRNERLSNPLFEKLEKRNTSIFLNIFILRIARVTRYLSAKVASIALYNQSFPKNAKHKHVTST